MTLNVVLCFAGAGYESSQCASSSSDELKANISWNQNTLNSYLYPTEGVNNSVECWHYHLPLGGL